MRFVLNGEPFELTSDEVRRRVRNVEPELVRQLGVRIDGKLYPVKQAFEAATGVHRRKFISHTARRHLAALGFEVVGEIESRSSFRPVGGKQAERGGDDTAVAGSADGWADIRPGQVFAGRYRIVALLGEGDRKRTYLAFDANLKRQVALALVKLEAARSDPAGTLREVEVLCRAGRHANIVTLHDQGIAHGIEYLVFNYLPGGTLRDYLSKRLGQPLSAEEIMRFGRQLARALSHVHQHGLVHRDVAPANVWLDERNEAHLGDFDSAVRREEQGLPGSLPTTTEAYVSPEQAAGGPVDERSDLYSLGAVLYEAATGSRPTRGEDGVVAPRTLRPDIPPKLNAIISKLMNEIPADRFATADDALAALRTGGPSQASPPSQKAAEGLLLWAETLPFPIASILWLYHGELDPRSKVDHLLKFFEATAEFTAAVQLSAYRSDPLFFEAHRASWFGARPGSGRLVGFDAATFGMWVNLSKRLAKAARRMLSGGDANRCRELFAAADQGLVEALASRGLAEILDEACSARNAWTGHGGVVGPREHATHLHVLEALLARTRVQIADSFGGWHLLKPGPAVYTGGLYDCATTVLTGMNQAFRKVQVQVRHPLDSAHLYLLNEGSPKALELVPLLRVLTGHRTGQDACYFYNRVQPDGRIRWVSYHYQVEPELLIAGNDVLEFLSDLHP